MERMKQKDEEARLERMNTRQRKGTPTVSNALFSRNWNLFSKAFVYFKRDAGLQTKVFFWMMESLDEQPKGKQDYDQWISDGIVVGKSKLSQFWGCVTIGRVWSHSDGYVTVACDLSHFR